MTPGVLEQFQRARVCCRRWLSAGAAAEGLMLALVAGALMFQGGLFLLWKIVIAP
ncbi:hypothetical protein [Solimonas sp. K1W22B-7]|uniref:hypothetical protein n=1 Tax=Solimonas sp. K1W22B-7 TaxID=2303331 RepID=UPI0013C3F68A|nr:hypothetical protein [Solimonas sp. K1W22B-7]